MTKNWMEQLTDDLVTEALTGKPVAPAAPAPIPTETEPAKPTRWRTLRTPDATRPSPRQQQREARNRAEAWYQCIREPQTKWREEAISSRSTHTTRPPSSNIVGQYTSGGSYVGLGYRVIYTPLGWLSESAVGAAISRQGGYLERVRQGQGLSSLIHGNGRGWNGSEAKVYALEVLALAAELGDQQAASQRGLLNVGV